MPAGNRTPPHVAVGPLRAGLDVEAHFSPIAGIFLYQLIVRGDRFDDPATCARRRAALEVAWRGMEA